MTSHQAKGHIQSLKYRTEIQTGNHTLIADEDLDVEGGDLGPNPGQLLASALAACSSITMRMYADRKGWPLEEAFVEIDFDRNIQDNTTIFTKKITLIGNLDETQRKRLHDIADKCPVHRILSGDIAIHSSLE